MGGERERQSGHPNGQEAQREQGAEPQRRPGQILDGGVQCDRIQARPLQDLSGGEQSGGRALKDGLAVAHRHATIGVLGDQAHVVRDERDRTPLVRQVAHERHDALRLTVVLPEGRLVEDDDLGLGDDHAGDRQPAFLAVTQHVRAHVLAAGQTDLLERGRDALLDLGLVDPHGTQRVRHLVVHGVGDELLLGTWKMYATRFASAANLYDVVALLSTRT
jgi:hypothetical protein